MPLGLPNGPSFTLHLSFFLFKNVLCDSRTNSNRQNARFKLFMCESLSQECLGACAVKTASLCTSFTEILKFLEVLNKKGREVSDEGAFTQSAYRSSEGR